MLPWLGGNLLNYHHLNQEPDRAGFLHHFCSLPFEVHRDHCNASKGGLERVQQERKRLCLGQAPRCQWQRLCPLSAKLQTLSSSQTTGGYTESLCQLLQTTQQSASQAKSTVKAQQQLVSEQAGVAFLASLSGSLQYNRTFLTDYIKISWPFHCFPNRFKLLSACRMSHKALIRTDKCLLGQSEFASFCCPSKSPPMSRLNPTHVLFFFVSDFKRFQVQNRSHVLKLRCQQSCVPSEVSGISVFLPSPEPRGHLCPLAHGIFNAHHAKLCFSGYIFSPEFTLWPPLLERLLWLHWAHAGDPG